MSYLMTALNYPITMPSVLIVLLVGVVYIIGLYEGARLTRGRTIK